MSDVAVLSREELTAIVREAIRVELAAAHHHEEREVLTREQTAGLLQTSPATVTRYVNKDGLPALKVGSEWRFKRSEVLTWLESRAVKRGAHTARAGKKLQAAKGAA